MLDCGFCERVQAAGWRMQGTGIRVSGFRVPQRQISKISGVRCLGFRGSGNPGFSLEQPAPLGANILIVWIFILGF